MPQEMNVLRCYACKMYQVHIVKKSNKWMCKICGEKQSIQAVYFQGSGMDCRHQVQHLNSLKATEDNRQAFTLATIDGYGLDCTADENGENNDIERCHCPKRLKLSNSKWSQYLESSDDRVGNNAPVDKENSDSPDNLDFADCRRKRRSSSKQSYSFPGISEEFREDESTEIQTFGAKSRSYPLRTRTLNILNKCAEDSDNETEEREALRRNDFTSAATSTSGKKFTGKWDRYLEVGKVERDTMCEDDFSLAKACSSGEKFTGKWDRYLEVGKVEQYTMCEDDFSSISTTCSGKKLSGKRDGYSDSETEEQYSTYENCSSSAATPSLTTKVDEFLKEPKDERESNFEAGNEQDEASTNNSTAARCQSTKCNIFEDYNDDLDFTIDF